MGELLVRVHELDCPRLPCLHVVWQILFRLDFRGRWQYHNDVVLSGAMLPVPEEELGVYGGTAGGGSIGVVILTGARLPAPEEELAVCGGLGAGAVPVSSEPDGTDSAEAVQRQPRGMMTSSTSHVC